MSLNDISAYKKSFVLSNYVWEIVYKWTYFEKDTDGKQIVRAIDSISVNIAEGFGRYGKKDKIKFYFYSRGSLKESLDWNEKTRIRKLITKEEYEKIFKELNSLSKEINMLIKLTNDNLEI